MDLDAAGAGAGAGAIEEGIKLHLCQQRQLSSTAALKNIITN